LVGGDKLIERRHSLRVELQQLHLQIADSASVRGGELDRLQVRRCDRPGERKARLVLEVLRDREADVLRFAHDLNVPATSNQAERDLRPSKTQQKISGRLTSEQRTKDRYRIRGYLSTAAKHGCNTMDALRDAIIGRPWIPPSPAPA